MSFAESEIMVVVLNKLLVGHSEDDEKVPSCGTGRRAGDLQALVDRGWPLHDEQTLYTATAHKSPQEVLAFELSTKISELGLQDIKALVDRGWPPHDEQTLYTATALKSLPSPL